MDVVDMNLPEAIAIQLYAVAKDSQHKYLMPTAGSHPFPPLPKEHFIHCGFQWIAEGNRKKRRGTPASESEPSAAAGPAGAMPCRAWANRRMRCSLSA